MAPHPLPPEILEPIKAVFFEECEELLAELEAGLLALKRGERDEETVNSVFRAAHSIKGGAANFGFDGLVAEAHKFESILARIRCGDLAADNPIVETMLRATDGLADHIRAAREGVPADAPGNLVFGDTLTTIPADENFAEHEPMFAAAGDCTAPESPPERAWLIHFRPRATLYTKANDPLLLLRELKRLGPVTVKLEDELLPPLRELLPEETYLGWTVELSTIQTEHAIREVFEFVEGDCELEVGPSRKDALRETAEARPAATAPVEPRDLPAGSKQLQTIRVDLERIDRLMNLVGELVVGQALLAQRLSTHDLGKAFCAESPLDELNQLTHDIQDSAMAMRAQPVKSVFQRMERLVRELEDATGKRVNLVMTGETTEVDRTVIEKLTDPLTHMIRNAVGHGIEAPAARAAANKPAEGTIRLFAAHRSGRIIIEIADDGAGIDRKRVRSIAAERGIIAGDVNLTDQDIDQLIFAPGFSTSDSISEISGRGVGMDVVKRSVQSLGGRITIQSRPGEGSVFSLSLPLTLALLDGMLVSIGGENFVLPVTTLLETLMPRPEDIHPYGPTALTIRFHGETVPLICLATALGRPVQPLPRKSVVLLVEDDHLRRAALLVDEIVGQRQVVIKSLQMNYRSVDSIAAATLLGDGRVALILDVNAIIDSHRRRLQAA
jgi:two-component system chemotaxis sensor kinase CheA